MVIDVPQSGSSAARKLAIGIAVCALAFVIGYFAIVATAWGHNFDNEAYLGRDAVGRFVVKADGDILAHITKATLLVALIVILIVAAVRRILLVGIIAVGAVVFAVAGAEVFKHVLPWRHLIASDYSLGEGLQAETYPSGHATIGSSLALAVVLISPAAWRWWMSVLAGLIMAGFGTAVVYSGWHRPSDAVGGQLWAGVVFGCAALGVIAIHRKQLASAQQAPDGDQYQRTSILLSAAGAIVVYGAIVALALIDHPTLPDLDGYLLTVSAVIVAVGFAVASWFGGALARLEWRDEVVPD